MFNIHKKQIEWGGRTLTLETGRLARQADGAVLVTYGETSVLCTAVGRTTPRDGIDFLPHAAPHGLQHDGRALLLERPHAHVLEPRQQRDALALPEQLAHELAQQLPLAHVALSPHVHV